MTIKVQKTAKIQNPLAEDKFFLHASPANAEQLRILDWWNALMPKVEFSVDVQMHAEHSHEEKLEILGRDSNVVFRFSWDDSADLFAWNDGILEVHVNRILGPKELQLNLGCHLAVEGPFLILEEGSRKTILLDLDFLDGKAKPMLNEIASVIAAATLLGQNSAEISTLIGKNLVEWDCPCIKDKHTGLEFFDLSNIHNVSHLSSIVDTIDHDSTIVIGGSIKSIPASVAHKIIEANLNSIFLEMFGEISAPDLDPDFQTHVKTFSEAVDLCFELAESAGKVYFLTGFNLQSATASAMSRRFQNELVPS